jgi:hypothetical protein
MAGEKHGMDEDTLCIMLQTLDFIPVRGHGGCQPRIAHGQVIFRRSPRKLSGE